jgi:hypothetical protein
MRSVSIVAVLVTFSLATVAAGLHAVAEKPNGGTQTNDRRPHSALIVITGIINKDGVGEQKAIRILNPQKIAALEAFFPNYQKRPTSERAGAWKEGYNVYFDYPDAESFRVTVSANGDSAFWTMRGGDFETRGDFKAFVASLQAPDADKSQPK